MGRPKSQSQMDMGCRCRRRCQSAASPPLEGKRKQNERERESDKWTSENGRNRKEDGNLLWAELVYISCLNTRLLHRYAGAGDIGAFAAIFGFDMIYIIYNI